MNDDKPTIRLAASGQYVSISLQELPESYDYLPYEGRRATIVAGSGVFRGEVVTTLWAFDLRSLHDVLSDLDRKVGQPEQSEWRSMESELTLRFELTQLGHLHVYVELRDGWYTDTETTLSFPIKADQTYLPMWIHQVKHALDSLTL